MLPHHVLLNCHCYYMYYELQYICESWHCIPNAYIVDVVVLIPIPTTDRTKPTVVIGLRAPRGISTRICLISSSVEVKLVSRRTDLERLYRWKTPTLNSKNYITLNRVCLTTPMIKNSLTFSPAGCVVCVCSPMIKRPHRRKYPSACCHPSVSLSSDSARC